MKICSECKIEKELDCFRKASPNKCKSCYNLYHKNRYYDNNEKHKEYKRNYYKKNIEKFRENNRIFRKNNPEKVLAAHTKSKLKKYGLTLEEFNAMLEKQDNRCAICKETRATRQIAGLREKSRFCIDHDHKSGKIRGILCDQCNKVLGLLYDNIETLQNAIKYLEESK